MGKRKITPEKQLADAVQCITESLGRWVKIAQDGCSDPAWADGTNMNLCRSHVIYGKCRVEELCAEYGLTIPMEFYASTPPYVDENYFVNPESERAQRIMNNVNWRCCTKETPQDPKLFLNSFDMP